MDKKIYSLILLLMIAANGFAVHRFFPQKYPEQQEFLQHGESIIFSQKQNAIAIAPQESVIKMGRGWINFSIQNKTSTPLNLYFQNVTLTDQYGRRIFIIPKNVLLSEEKRKTGWAHFGSFLCTLCDTLNADRAGTIHYSEHSITRGRHFTERTMTTGTMHSEALRQQALTQAGINASCRDYAINENLNQAQQSLLNFYFDSNTIMPNQLYESSFQFEIPRKVEKDLQYMFVSFDIGSEHHTFCFSFV